MQLSTFQPTISFIEEPPLKLHEDLSFPEPKMGWTLAGPPGTTDSTVVITLGLVGDSESLEACTDMLERMKCVTYGKTKGFLHIDFPGLEKLNIQFDIKYKAEITPEEIKRVEETSTISERIACAGNIIQSKLVSLADKEPQPNIIMLAYPKRIDYLCITGAIGKRKLRPKTDYQKNIERRMKQHLTLDHWGGTAAPTVRFKPMDLRSLVKAASMNIEIPVQILRPTTTHPYDPARSRREDDATTFWNLLVALFYKSNRLPWGVNGLPHDTCYVGVAFYRDRDDFGTVRTSLTQVFSLNTEGYVFKGKPAVTDENNSPHVSEQDAIGIVEKALEVYKLSNEGNLPRRLVVHKTSRYDEGELKGFSKGAEQVSKVDLLAFGQRDIKLLRWGTEPPLRGTCVRLPDKSLILYTYGYIPYMDVYPGPRVPAPLQILEHHGRTSKEEICKEILALTKLNWNNAKYCSRAPVTIAFAQRVGTILRQSPPDTEFKDRFRYYM